MRIYISLALILFLSMTLGVVAGQILIPRPVQAIVDTSKLTPFERGQLTTECYAASTGMNYDSAWQNILSECLSKIDKLP
jgi:hypothetical protein